MKTKVQSILWSALLASGVMLATTVRAEDAEGAKKPAKEQRQEPRDRLEMMKEHLGLTEAQVTKLKPILIAERDEIQALRKDMGKDADRTAIREKIQAIRAKYKTQIDAILTEEQKAKMEKLRERGPKGPKGPDGAGGPPQPPAE